MLLIIFTLFISACESQNLIVPDYKLTFNPSFYENVLDEELCREQMQYLIRNNTMLLFTFLDAGIRTPRGILEENPKPADYGNYHQCLEINQQISISSAIEGKYCSIELPVSDFELPDFPFLDNFNIPWAEIQSKFSSIDENKRKLLKQYQQMSRGTQPAERTSSSEISFELAVCLPKPCTTQQFLKELIGDELTETGLFQYNDLYCRLPNDKQWVAADYVAITIFSILFLLLIASTCYDVFQTAILKNDPRDINQIYRSFSIVANSTQLVTYKPVPGVIECLDGIRAISMIWIIAHHTYGMQFGVNLVNPMDLIMWMNSLEGLWISVADIAVDTFFLMSGILVVYTTVGKMTRISFLKNLHIFYFNRIMRMLPVLAAMILLQVSILNRLSDGPNWDPTAKEVEKCRVNWWNNLLFMQNWVHFNDMCVTNTWYLAVDLQLYILSPLVLFWLIQGKKATGWIALATALVLSLVGSTIYNFLLELPSTGFGLASFSGFKEYAKYYYYNTFTRSPPFIIGMVFGYILHLYRKERLQLSSVLVGLFWVSALAIIGVVIWIYYPISQIDWDNQTVDGLINSFRRPLWAVAVGWIILACQQGYGGPVNWLLSLQCFKVPSRLSYSMYVVHYGLIKVVYASNLTVTFFSPNALLFTFLGHLAMAVMAAYVLTMLVDAPCANLVKQLLDKVKNKAPKPPSPQNKEEDVKRI